jgi:hypothetical protein
VLILFQTALEIFPPYPGIREGESDQSDYFSKLQLAAEAVKIPAVARNSDGTPKK